MISPCIMCGTRVSNLSSPSYGKLYSFEALDGGILCSGCFSEFDGGTDPMLYGYPSSEFSVASLLASKSFRELKPAPKAELGYGCPDCLNSTKKQEFALNNARKHGVKLPEYYWPYAEEKSNK